jgi:hypothetical protein
MLNKKKVTIMELIPKIAQTLDNSIPQMMKMVKMRKKRDSLRFPLKF